MRQKLTLIIALFWVGFLFAQTEVVFLEVRDFQGNLVILESDFPYAHVALFHDGYYLHAHPRSGVVWVTEEELGQVGEIRARINLSSAEPIIPLQWLGKAYDSGYSWDDERFYCSELVAKALKIPPEPMHFEPGLWPPSFGKLEGLPGISPGKIYKKIHQGLFSFSK